MKQYVVILILLIVISCEINTEEEIKLAKKETYSILQEEKAMYPGLGFEKDTTINIVHVFDPKDNVIHEMFITNIKTDQSSLIDSLLDIEKYKNDTVRIFQVDGKPISIYKNKFTFFLYGGFGGKKVDFFQNDKKMNVEENTDIYFNYLKVDKSSIDSIGVSVNNSIPTYSAIDKEYNYLRLFLIADSTVQFNYLHHWDENLR